jgi:hypothetical protein
MLSVIKLIVTAMDVTCVECNKAECCCEKCRGIKTQHGQVLDHIYISEMTFKMKNIFCNLIKRNAQHFYHEPFLIKLVPSLSFVCNFIIISFD